jgi:hypothetical protein
MPIFNSGTKTFFNNATAPPGWTKDTSSYNNHTLRLVSGSVSSGGSLDFTSVIGIVSVSGSLSASSPVSTGATTLDSTTVAAHTHTYIGGRSTANTTTRNSGVSSPFSPFTANVTVETGSVTGGGTAHSHSIFPIGLTFSATLSFDIKYVDIILATLN